MFVCFVMLSSTERFPIKVFPAPRCGMPQMNCYRFAERLIVSTRSGPPCVRSENKLGGMLGK